MIYIILSTLCAKFSHTLSSRTATGGASSSDVFEFAKVYLECDNNLSSCIVILDKLAISVLG